MDSRERVLMAINHQESDRIPFDLGGMAQSGIHRLGYAKLRAYLGLPNNPIRILNINTQQAKFDKDIQDRLLIDATMVYSKWANVEAADVVDEGEFWAYIDEWGVKRVMPKEDGLYFDVMTHPLAVDDVVEKFKHYPWPDPADPTRFHGLHEEARQARQDGKFVVLMGLCPGIVEMYAWLRGFDRFYVDLAAEPQIAEMFLEKMAELKIAYWQRVLSEMGGSIDAINEADDMAGQTNLLLSPKTYRAIIKPYHRKLFDAIKQSKPDVKIILHTCGAVRKLIPDFIEIGVDVLNPVQVSASGMDPVELKREFGKDISFWGGGVDAQNILTNGSAQEIKDNVIRNIDALAPGGGFIFAPTHIIQPFVSPENIMVMWETLQEYGSKYNRSS
jgi:uroporphyrinogen decarboxylase